MPNDRDRERPPIIHNDPDRNSLTAGKLGAKRLLGHSQWGNTGSRVQPLSEVIVHKPGDPLAQVESGAFYRVYIDAFGGTDYYYLQGGVVTGTGGNKTVDNIRMEAVGSEPADGAIWYLKVTGDPVEEDDVLLPGLTIDSVTPGSHASTLPDDDTVSPGDTDVDCYVRLGIWHNSVFQPDDRGNLMVIYCLGAFRKVRE